MKTKFFQYESDHRHPIYTIDEAIILQKGTYVNFRSEDFIVESVNMMLGYDDDHIEILLISS